MFEPLPEKPSPIQSSFSKIVIISFVASIAGILLSFGICANTAYNSSQANVGLIVFLISLLGVVVSTIAGIIRIIVLMFRK